MLSVHQKNHGLGDLEVCLGELEGDLCCTGEALLERDSDFLYTPSLEGEMDLSLEGEREYSFLDLRFGDLGE